MNKIVWFAYVSNKGNMLMDTYRYTVSNLANLANSPATMKRAVVSFIKKEGERFNVCNRVVYCRMSPDTVELTDIHGSRKWSKQIGPVFYGVNEADRRADQADAVYIQGFLKEKETEEKALSRISTRGLQHSDMLLWYARCLQGMTGLTLSEKPHDE